MAITSCRALSSLRNAVNETPMQPINPGSTRARKIPLSFRPVPTLEPSDLKTDQPSMPLPTDATTNTT